MGDRMRSELQRAPTVEGAYLLPVEHRRRIVVPAERLPPVDDSRGQEDGGREPVAFEYGERVVGHIGVAVVETEPDDSLVPPLCMPCQGLLDVEGLQAVVRQTVHLVGEAPWRYRQLVGPIGDPVIEEDAHPWAHLPRPQLPE